MIAEQVPELVLVAPKANPQIAAVRMRRRSDLRARFTCRASPDSRNPPGREGCSSDWWALVNKLLTFLRTEGIISCPEL
jgi:hypothetical protein